MKAYNNETIEKIDIIGLKKEKICKHLECIGLYENNDYIIKNEVNKIMIIKKTKFIYDISRADIKPDELFLNNYLYKFENQMKKPEKIDFELITGQTLKYLYPEIPKNENNRHYYEYLFKFADETVEENGIYDLYSSIFKSLEINQIKENYIRYVLTCNLDNYDINILYKRIRKMIQKEEKEVENLEQENLHNWDKFAKKILVSIGLIIPLAITISTSSSIENEHLKNVLFDILLLLTIAMFLNFLSEIPNYLLNKKKINYYKNDKSYKEQINKIKNSIYIFMLVQIIIFVILISIVVFLLNN